MLWSIVIYYLLLTWLATYLLWPSGSMWQLLLINHDKHYEFTLKLKATLFMMREKVELLDFSFPLILVLCLMTGKWGNSSLKRCHHNHHDYHDHHDHHATPFLRHWHIAATITTTASIATISLLPLSTCHYCCKNQHPDGHLLWSCQLCHPCFHLQLRMSEWEEIFLTEKKWEKYFLTEILT